MSQIDYAAMSDKALRQYFLRHRNDQEAFYAYMDRLNAKPRKIIANVGDPDVYEKLTAAFFPKIQAAEAENRVND
ncbi:MAG: hypothetical protein WBA76_18410 [Phormidesmis sp.]